MGISNATVSNSNDVAIGIGNSVGQTGISIGVQNNNNSQTGIGIGYYNSDNIYTAVAVGISNTDNRGAVVFGRGNTTNRGYQINNNRTVVVGLTNTNNGKNNNQFGTGPMTIFGVDNTQNFSGSIYGDRNTNINQVTIFGNDNADIVNGDGS